MCKKCNKCNRSIEKGSWNRTFLRVFQWENYLVLCPLKRVADWQPPFCFSTMGKSLGVNRQFLWPVWKRTNMWISCNRLSTHLSRVLWHRNWHRETRETRYSSCTPYVRDPSRSILWVSEHCRFPSKSKFVPMVEKQNGRVDRNLLFKIYFLNTWDSSCNLIGSCPCLYHTIKTRLAGLRIDPFKCRILFSYWK